MTMPEKIFADQPSIFDGSDVWHSEPSIGRVEYIRADLVAARIDAAIQIAAKGAYEEGYQDGRCGE